MPQLASLLLTFHFTLCLADGEPPAVLTARCLPCHGPERMESGLRVDLRATLLQGGDSGLPALEPGDSSTGTLLERVTSTDPERRMPPRGAALTAAEIDALRTWIADGAPTAGPAASTSTHWAFQPPSRPPVPEFDAPWARPARTGDALTSPSAGAPSPPRNPIDHFVRARLADHSLAPAPEADRWTLIRRLSLDLTGLPPSPEEAAAFVDDPAPNADERLVERLLASEHHGEHVARTWLDLARYSDTHGYEKDRPRSVWPWRDALIDALNRDQPFDEFTVQQLAGDLLPDADLEDRMATGFHRNTMINEEGGIDVEEFRWLGVVDRVDTTAAVWLGLTVGCARCHTHKYDPITQREYWSMFDLLNQDDEVELSVPDDEVEAERARILAEIARLEEELPRHLLAAAPMEWSPGQPTIVASRRGARVRSAADGTVTITGPAPDRDCTTVMLSPARPGEWDGVTALKLEALRRETPGSETPLTDEPGPGRTAHGNFVLTELRVFQVDASGLNPRPLSLVSATADLQQPAFPASGAIDGEESTGWAVDEGHRPIPGATAIFTLAEPLGGEVEGLRIEMDQQYGGGHTLAAFRLSLGSRAAQASTLTSSAETSTDQPAPSSPTERALADALAGWEADTAPLARHWHALSPTAMHAEQGASLRMLDDGSILAYGDKPNRDTYILDCPLPADRPVAALRLDALPHPSLPLDGPGRAPLFMTGDFLLSEVQLELSLDGGKTWTPRALSRAQHDFAQGGREAAKVLDGQLDTGWSIGDRTGQTSHLVLTLAEPLDLPTIPGASPSSSDDSVPSADPSGDAPDPRLRIRLVHHYIHQTTLGRFQLWTSDRAPETALPLSATEEAALLLPAEERSDDQRALLRKAFLRTTPRLESRREAIAALRRQLPRHPTTLILEDRGEDRRRTTTMHRRGEFLQPMEQALTGNTPAVLHPFPEDAPRNRLGLARWLVDPASPLVARVTVNRTWQMLFGHGLVTTPEDFGTRGERPSHPDLLDWLAVEFMEQGWSHKQLLRTIVNSATYRQSAVGDEDSWRRDPRNRWLSRGPRFRLDAEVLRDQALAAAGLLNRQLGGPPVFPPQPDGVTSLSYGAMNWNTATGAQRFRRGLYTYRKRTAPYAPFALFDAPSGEVSCTRRARTSTPLQALVLLNDTVFQEAAQGLARRVLREAEGDEARLDRAFRLCLVRPPDQTELGELRALLQLTRERLSAGSLDAEALAGTLPGDEDEPALARPANRDELAAWAVLARVLLNLDETQTKE